MGIITVARGSYSHGQEIAEKVAQKLGWNCISREVILEASEEFNIPEIKLTQAFDDAPSILDRFIHGKRKYIAYTRAVLLQHLTKGNVIYHGFAGHFFVESISHVLKILITANIEDSEKEMGENAVWDRPVGSFPLRSDSPYRQDYDRGCCRHNMPGFKAKAIPNNPRI